MNDEVTQLVRTERIKFAESLDEFNSQLRWYDEKASRFKTKAQYIDLLIISFGALVAAIPVLKPNGDPHWTEILVSFLGAAIVFGQGLQRIFRYRETWPEYRLASERMKREWRLFINQQGNYDSQEDTARSRYIDTLESIMAKEQKIFFEARRSQPNKTQ